MTPDQINGLFEIFGAIFIGLSCRRIYLDKNSKGVSLFHALFFWVWGIFNVYFYPTAGLWFSFVGGLGVIVTNTLWVWLMVYYRVCNAK